MQRSILRTFALLAALTLAPLVGAPAVAGASTVTPDYNAGNFSANSGVSVVTGTVWFDSGTNFHLTNVKLTDTKCGDNRAAEFRVIAYDLAGDEIDYPWHSLINDCSSPVIWTRLSGSASSGYINYLKIQTNACQGGIFTSCSSSGFSRLFYDSFS